MPFSANSPSTKFAPVPRLWNRSMTGIDYQKARNQMHNRTTISATEPETHPPGGVLLMESQPQDWNGIRVALYRTPPQLTAVKLVSSDDFLCLHLDNAAYVTYQCEGRTYTAYSQPGNISLHSKQECRRFQWDNGVLTMMHLHLSSLLLARTIAEVSSLDPARIELVGRFNFQDPLLLHLLFALRDEMVTNSLFGRAYFETLSTTLVLHLLRHYASLPLQSSTLPGRLSRQQVSQVRDYIYDHLAQEVSVAAMAATLGFSISYFTRLFKEATGLSPYQYVIQCRLEHAQHLLQDPRLTIAEVAQRTGFTDQSHLHRHLKRNLDLTPGDIRRVEWEKEDKK
jgi:AraC family transcriptional regulator